MEEGTPTVVRGTSSFKTSLEVCIDARGVHSAIEAKETKTPAESSLLSSVQSVRELLDLKRLRALHWIDTRDMLGDGLTKGAVQRDAIILLLNKCLWKTTGDPPYSLWAFLASTSVVAEDNQEGPQCQAYPDGRTVYFKWTTVTHRTDASQSLLDPAKWLYSPLADSSYESGGLAFLTQRTGVG